MRYPIFLLLALSAGSMGQETATTARIVDGASDRVPLQTVAPDYPRKARRDRLQGQVQVCFDIDRDGKPRRIAVRTSTNRAFERPSIKAVKASLFKPLSKDEQLQSIKTCRTFIFELVPLQAEN